MHLTTEKTGEVALENPLSSAQAANVRHLQVYQGFFLVRLLSLRCNQEVVQVIKKLDYRTPSHEGKYSRLF